MASRKLFGGAITATLPTRLVDASAVRQVPDNQEVFLYPDSGASIIVEVLERVSEERDEEAVKFHFNALAHDNNAISSTMQDPVVKDNGAEVHATVLRGTQSIRKFNSKNPDEVEILMALFRVKSERANVDLVISANIPVRSEDGGVVGKDGMAAILADFTSLVLSFRIVNYDLFR